MVPRVLTIAGSDSSGGAGIEADLKTFTVHGCYGMTCITGLTAQNTQGVRRIYPVEEQQMIKDTLDAVFEDVGVDAVKTGMLSSKETIRTVVSRLQEHRAATVVIDPVMVTTSGAELISKQAIDVYINELFPLATLITPNLLEAEHIAEELGLAKVDIRSVDSLKELAQNLGDKLGCNVLLKGGHAGVDDEFNVSAAPTKLVDVLYTTSECTLYENAYVQSQSTHGTGCTLASAITANIANGQQLAQAVGNAINYVQQAIQTATQVGRGNGPVNHMHNITVRPFVKGKFLEYLLQHPKVVEAWDRYVNHPFTKQIAKGTVDEARFKQFLSQDYQYLRHYSRAHCLAGFKSTDLEVINSSADIVRHINVELQMHLEYCAEFGLTQQQLDQQEESQACVAYTRYLLDVGHQEDWLALKVALSPCLFGYLQAAEILNNDPSSVRHNNPYWRWVENYLADDYREASRLGRQVLETHVMDVSPVRLEQLVDIFVRTTKMECAFWDACL